MIQINQEELCFIETTDTFIESLYSIIK